MKLLMTILALVLSVGCSSLTPNRMPSNQVVQKIYLSAPTEPRAVPFISRSAPGPFALSLNIPYPPVKELRIPIEKAIGRKLDFFKGWDSQGEAHVTTVTPPEFSNILSQHLSAEDIESIALSNGIQSADLLILGIGSGQKEISGTTEETFFVIVDSQKLRHIRNEIWKLFVKKGGDPKAWDPTSFFPHITIGYTKQDLYEPDVIKNIKFSWDRRFHLINP